MERHNSSSTNVRARSLKNGAIDSSCTNQHCNLITPTCHRVLDYKQACMQLECKREVREKSKSDDLYKE